MNAVKTVCVSTIIKTCVVAALLLITSLTQGAEPSEFRVQGGTVKFTASTNVSVMTVRGQSTQMTATLRLRRDAGHVELEDVHARIDPKTFTTGMSVRDQHLRKKVFSLDNDAMPELQFASDKITCPELSTGRDATCPVSGQLTLHGVVRPFAINILVLNDGKTYRISGAGAVKLSSFGIEPPCQLGVCVADEVKLSLEFQAKQTPFGSAGGY